jgi:hypothetical protein
MGGQVLSESLRRAQDAWWREGSFVQRPGHFGRPGTLEPSPIEDLETFAGPDLRRLHGVWDMGAFRHRAGCLIGLDFRWFGVIL